MRRDGRLAGGGGNGEVGAFKIGGSKRTEVVADGRGKFRQGLLNLRRIIIVFVFIDFGDPM